MESIGTYKWGEVYKRVLLIDANTNIGIEPSAKYVYSGDGAKSPLLLGLSEVGVSGACKLYFGDPMLFIRKKREGALEIQADVGLISKNVSAMNMTARDMSASDLIADRVTGRVVAATQKVVALNVSAQTANVRGAATFGSVNASMVNVIHMNAKTIQAEKIGYDNVEAIIGEFCTVRANSKVVSPSVSAASLLGCDNVMSWW
jgi:hypothetical protein